MNFLQETTALIQSLGLTPEDIDFIGSEKSGHSCTWEQFLNLADFEYDSGYGSQRVATDLIIVFKDGTRAFRSEYAGSEGWDTHVPFKKPRIELPIERLIHGNCRWSTLSTIQKQEDEELDED